MTFSAFGQENETIRYTEMYNGSDCLGQKYETYCVLHCECNNNIDTLNHTDFIKVCSWQILDGKKNGEWKYYHPNSIECCSKTKYYSILDSVVYYKNGIRICSNDTALIDSIKQKLCPQQIYFEEITKKPIIYLYPKEPQEIELKIEYEGKIKTTYPKYNSGWKVMAYPNSKIINLEDNKEYSYLFWDGETNYSAKQRTYEDGFIVSRDTALKFLQNILTQTGLNPKEYNEFIVYWLPYIENNEFTFIHFLTGHEYDIISKNVVLPKPDNEIRVFIEFKKVDTYFKILPQKFNFQNREGFTLVEWGGSEIRSPIRIKTKDNKYIEK